MKRLLTAFLIVLIPVSLFAGFRRSSKGTNVALMGDVTIVAPTPIPDPVSLGLQGYWALEDNLNDSSTNSITAVLSGDGSESEDYTDGVNGGRAFSFNGHTGLDIDSYSLHPVNLTVSFWMKDATPVDYECDVNLGDGSLGNTQEFYHDSAGITAGITPGAVSTACWAVVTSGNWNWYCYVYDGSNLYIFINNQLVKKTAKAGNLVYYALNDKNRIGARIGDLHFSTSYIDEVLIYDRALTHGTVNVHDIITSEVLQNYQAGGGT